MCSWWYPLGLSNWWQSLTSDFSWPFVFKTVCLDSIFGEPPLPLPVSAAETCTSLTRLVLPSSSLSTEMALKLSFCGPSEAGLKVTFVAWITCSTMVSRISNWERRKENRIYINWRDRRDIHVFKKYTYSNGVYNCKATIVIYTCILTRDTRVNSSVENSLIESLYLQVGLYTCKLHV